MPRTILEVFLSSTGEDLTDHREAVHARIQTIEYFRCVRQEDFGAQNAKAVAFCRDKARAADLFVGLIGLRRGWEPGRDKGKRSITEMEHDWARQAGRRRFIWVSPDDFPVPGNKHESTSKHNRQLAFRSRTMAGGERIVSQKGFDSPELLAAEIALQLMAHIYSGDLIRILRSDLAAPSRATVEDQQPAIAAAVEQLARDEDIDLAALANAARPVKAGRLEAKLKARAQAREKPAGRKNDGDRKAAAAYWRHLGALAFLHDTKKALAAYNKAIALDPDDADGWRRLGELQHRVGRLDLAEKAFGRLLAIGESIPDLKVQSMGHLRQGWISFDRRDFAAAERSAERARRLAAAAHWGEGIARAYGNLGNVHFMRGDFKKAEHMHLQALKLEQGLGNAEQIARTYGNLGAVYRKRGALTKAEHMQRKALKLNQEIGNTDGMARAYASLGNIYNRRRQFAHAKQMHATALGLYKKLDSTANIAITYGNLGLVNFKRGDLAAAAAAYRRSLALYQDIGNDEAAARAHMDLAAVRQKTNDEAGMRKHLRAARDLWTKLDQADQVAEIDKMLAALDRRKRDRRPPARKRSRTR